MTSTTTSRSELRRKKIQAAERDALRRVGEKWCPTCRHARLLSQFYFNKATLDGFHAECKQCSRDRSAAWRAKNQQRHEVVSTTTETKMQNLNGAVIPLAHVARAAGLSMSLMLKCMSEIGAAPDLDIEMPNGNRMRMVTKAAAATLASQAEVWRVEHARKITEQRRQTAALARDAKSAGGQKLVRAEQKRTSNRQILNELQALSSKMNVLLEQLGVNGEASKRG